MIIEDQEKLLYKAIYMEKYVGFFYVGENRIEVINNSNTQESKFVNINNCLKFRNTGARDKNDSSIFENDLLLSPKEDLIGVVTFKNCRFYIEYNNGSSVQLTDRYVKKCFLLGDLIVDGKIYYKSRADEGYYIDYSDKPVRKPD